MTTIHYQPGRRLLFVSRGRVLLVDDGEAYAADIWDAFSASDDGVPEALSGINAPWVLIDSAGSCRMQGKVLVTVNWLQGSQALDDEASISDALASSPASLRIGPPASLLAAHGHGLALTDGVVLAESVSVELDRMEPPAEAERIEPDLPPRAEDTDSPEDAAPEGGPGPGADADGAADPGHSANRTIIWTETETPPSTPEAEAQPIARPALIDGIPGDLGFSGPDPLAPPVEPVPAANAPLPPPIDLPVPPAAPFAPRPPADPAATAPPMPDPPVIESVEPQAPDPDEELQMTVDRSKVVPAQPDRLETVLAASCPLGHVSPAFAPQCRVCGRDIAPQQPQTIARPMLGRLVLPDNESVDLDRPVIFGRAPRLLDEQGERPHLINISRYGEYLSRMHLEVALQGWHVLARDLGSTSGTSVTLPGRPPENLRPDEPVVLEPGSIVDLAGSYVFRFEVSG